MSHNKVSTVMIDLGSCWNHALVSIITGFPQLQWCVIIVVTSEDKLSWIYTWGGDCGLLSLEYYVTPLHERSCLVYLTVISTGIPSIADGWNAFSFQPIFEFVSKNKYFGTLAVFANNLQWHCENELNYLAHNKRDNLNGGWNMK
jgi:hypothetical protein